MGGTVGDIKVMPARRPFDPWQAANGQWFTPGEVTEKGDIVSTTAGQLYSAGHIIVARQQAQKAERHGWRIARRNGDRFEVVR